MAVFAGIAGCVAYTPRPIDLAAKHALLAEASLDDEATARLLNQCGMGMPTPHREWKKAELTCVALARSPRMSAARGAVEEALAGAITARARPNPTLSVSLDRTAGVSALPWLWGFVLDVPLDGSTRRKLRMASADVAVRAARLDYAEQSWALRRDVHAAVRSMLMARQRTEVAERMTAAARDWLAAIEARIVDGEAAAVERGAPRLALSRALGEQAQSRQRADEASTRAAVALGLLPSALSSTRWQEAWTLPPPPVADLDALRRNTLAHRADLARALRDYDARELDLQGEVRKQYPQLSIGPGYTYDHGARKLTFALSATLPLFDRNAGPIAQAKARRQTAESRVDAVQATIAAELDGAVTGLVTANAALIAASEQRWTTARAFDRLRRARDAGAEDRAALRASEVEALDGQLAELTALESELTAHAALEDALRLPLDAEERAFARSVAYREDQPNE
ncbi:CRISPR system Cascade subunit CasA [Tahibacter aquaticus]|uniref:CRISPR system Cascade subunit CasA n=1 Tax=Tahibacter aquaticus TaxID=520092 RepID=A0A4R6Z271_9GAMM|nr:TolC family protein [Tahibacter aquaticus]TDR45670.1 CRISPR system Cascade subunit CasA [Tahibacter aquaticus]